MVAPEPKRKEQGSGLPPSLTFSYDVLRTYLSQGFDGRENGFYALYHQLRHLEVCPHGCTVEFVLCCDS